MTFTDNRIIKNLLENDGIYKDGEFEDPQCTSVWVYRNKKIDKILYAVFYREIYNDLNIKENSDIENQVCLWRQESGITEEGKAWLEKKEEKDVKN